MNKVDELLGIFGNLNIGNDHNNKNECKVHHDTEKASTLKTTDDNKQHYASAPWWMKEFKFVHILLPIHDAIFPNEVFGFDESKHRVIFNAIDMNNDGFISQREFLKATSVSTEQSVIPIQRIYEVFRDINFNKNRNGISFDAWMKCVLNINLDSIPNNKRIVNHKVDDDDNKTSDDATQQQNMLSMHIPTVLSCIHNVWNTLGPSHRESAYQKALMFELIDSKYRIFMEHKSPVYHYTKHKKKIHLVSMERIDLYIKYPATVIEMKAVASKLSVKDEYQTKKYSRNRKCLSFLVNCPNNRDDLEIKCWEVQKDGKFHVHDLSQYKQITSTTI